MGSIVEVLKFNPHAIQLKDTPQTHCAMVVREMATASPPYPPPSTLPPSPSATLATATTSTLTTPLSRHLPAPSPQCGVSSVSSPCLEEQLLDYDSSPSLRSKTSKGSCQSTGLQVTQNDGMPSYKDVLLSSPPLELASQRPHKSREESSPAAADPRLTRAFEGSTIARTEAASRQASCRGKTGRTTTISVKASERAMAGAKRKLSPTSAMAVRWFNARYGERRHSLPHPKVGTWFTSVPAG
jgi:hypothetical protein